MKVKVQFKKIKREEGFSLNPLKPMCSLKEKRGINFFLLRKGRSGEKKNELPKNNDTFLFWDSVLKHYRNWTKIQINSSRNKQNKIYWARDKLSEIINILHLQKQKWILRTKKKFKSTISLNRIIIQKIKDYIHISWTLLNLKQFKKQMTISVE